MPLCGIGSRGVRSDDGTGAMRDETDSPIAVRPSGDMLLADDMDPPMVTHQTLAAWRAGLAKIRDEERKRSLQLPEETGRLLEIVGQALAQGGGSLPASDIARIEEITRVDATYG